MATPEHTLDPTPAPDSQAPRAERRTPRGLIMRLHFYAGVLVGPFILVAALTGALYALAPTIERFVYADLLTVEPGGSPIPLSDQAASARQAYGDLTLSGVRPPAGPADSTRFIFADPALAEDLQRAVFVDPYTARILGDEPTWFGYLPLSTWLDGLHRHLQLGESGRLYSELAASWLWVVALGGLYLWVVRPALTRRRARGRTRTRNRHGGIGVWALAMLLFLSATGITWSTYAGAHVTELRAALDWQRPQLSTGHHAATSAAGAPAAVDLDGVVGAADGAGVRAPVEVTLPAEGDAGVPATVTELDKPFRLTTNAASIDPVTLAVPSEIDYWRDYPVVARLADWGIRMHMGFLFGVLNQVLLFAVGAATVTMIVLGYRMWWQRRPTQGPPWAPGRPPRRGGIRRIPLPATAVLALAAVAVGWFLPLLGISLAGFLLVDAVIGALKARRARHLT